MPDVDSTERELVELSQTLTAPHPGECLACYLDRMLTAYHCVGGHRFSDRWGKAQPRSMPGLVAWAQRNGGCCCDCEVVMNVLQRGRRLDRYEPLVCRAALARWQSEDDEEGEEDDSW